MLGLISGNVIAPLAEPSGFPAPTSAPALVKTTSPTLLEPHLLIYVNAETDVVWAISITARHKAGRHYFLAPKRFSFTDVERCLDVTGPIWTSKPFKERPATRWTDADLDKLFRRGDMEKAAQLAQLALRWSILEPLVLGHRPERLFDPTTRRPLITARSTAIVADRHRFADLFSPDRQKKATKEKAYHESVAAQRMRIEKEIVRLLFMYWAGGSFRGALIGFANRCGGRGKNRAAAEKKRGRPNSEAANGDASKAGINVTADSEHAKIIKFCHHTWVVRGTPVAVALRRMWDEFYAVAVQQPDGGFKNEWLPAEERPTAGQFDFWGTRESPASAAWRKHLAPGKFDKRYRVLIGSAHDDVMAVGQRGGIDSTPPDIHFVRAIDRLARIGGGHRIIVVDSMFGFIPGLYMGLDPPSAPTVRLALYNALDPDKRQFLDDLSLEDIPEDDWIPMWFASLLADNTDLRNMEIMACAAAINTNLHFVPKMRSDLNPMAESGHHMLHRLSDHRSSGTTHGRKAERGEVSGIDRARHTIMEALRETVRAIHCHNTMELDDKRPLRMRAKNVPPTRLHMTREYIRLGRVARSMQSIELARNHLLPRRAGTFTPQGVRLHRNNDSKKVEYIDHVAYVSRHPIAYDLCEQARRGGKLEPDYFRREFLVHPYLPRRIWYVDLPTGEVIELDFKVLGPRDPDLPYVMTMPDMLDRVKIEGVERARQIEAQHRKRAGIERAQRESDDRAEDAYQDALTARGSAPSKQELRSDRRENREAEKAGMLMGVAFPEALVAGASLGAPSPDGPTDPPAAVGGSSTSAPPSPAPAPQQPPPLLPAPADASKAATPRPQKWSLLSAATQQLARNTSTP